MAVFLPLLIAIASIVEIGEAMNLPEMTLSTPELIKYWGYPAETHKPVTKDGYILTLFRIPYGKVNSTASEKKQRPVFYLQHALMSSSADWVINLPHQSLGFVLADQGFDVWMGNVRGNRYSKKHVSLDVTSKEFWNFSIDEHAKYDFPAMVHYILKNTSQDQLFYVGHSQGTIMPFAGLSENQELQSKIKVLFALGPISRIRHTNDAVKGIASWAWKFALIRKLFNIQEIFPSARGTGRICWFLPETCKAMMGIISGYDPKHTNNTRLPIYIAHTPAGTSTKNMLHWLQLVNMKLCTKYDYGEEENLKHYKSKVPPEYDISKVHTPTVIISASNDTLSSPEDVKWTIAHLPNVIDHFEIKEYNHFDFIWGINAGKVLHEKIIQIARTT